VDRRAWKQCRDIQVSYNKNSGVAIVSLGDTKVMCHIDSEISAPRKSSRPGSGSIQFSMEFLSMAHSSSTESTLDNETEECLTMLETLYRDTYCIDFETLCIEMNQYVYDLKCTLKVLDYDGGLFDCATLAVTTALIGFKRNDATYNGITKQLVVHSVDDRPMIPLTLYYKPATVTFGFVDGIEDPIVDPTETESALINGYLVVGANHRGEICLMYQSGNVNVSPETVMKCSEHAILHSKTMTDKMDNPHPPSVPGLVSL